ncbi:DUF1707 domain-containing protein [Propioniciclava coleopterorum]|uniref:DUF1707 domain-containing protein n=1 Tax=Propioniciclava coleopterorum TaxID=2714937 RepID=A0A6G7Y9P8_9ACTN|nr:DUF1707 domain-containing protein [Propioniciclava coleopterorum]QIK73361.1 DUF1707 domain-containing protein [Propioniciclava coleopterorum]
METHEPALPDGHLRVTPAQREHALARLREAAADQRIRFEELEARTASVLEAVTRDDLAAPLYDLVPTADLPGATGEVALGDGPGLTWERPLVLRAEHWWRTVKIAGAWEVPPFLEVNASRGPILLDFQRAVALAPVIDVVVNASWLGSVTIVVPRGWGVDATQATGASTPRSPARSTPARTPATPAW